MMIRRALFAAALFSAGLGAGWVMRPQAVAAGPDALETIARNTDRIADALYEMKRAAGREVRCDCRK